MSTLSEEVAEIALITDDNGTAELIDTARDDLADQIDSYGGPERFKESRLIRWASAATAEAKLAALEKDSEPALIVLDIMVRRETRGGNPGNGQAGVALLDWLYENKPHIPVIVLGAQGVDGLGVRMLERPLITCLTIGTGDLSSAFAKALASLTGARGARQRITVEVGMFGVRYSIVDGHRKLTSGDHEFPTKNSLEELGRKADAFKPNDPRWQETIRDLGDSVFTSIIAGTIGPHILTHMRRRAPASGNTSPSVDLRFEIFVPNNELVKFFGLPFELAKPPEDADNYLCTRVPMARRMRFEESLDEDVHPDSDAPRPHNKKMRMLFINASFEGSAIARSEVSGDLFRLKVGKLENTAAELKDVRAFATDKNGAVLLPPTVLGGGARPLSGDRLLQELEDQITQGDYDIIHFAGHSATLEGNGGTFLILPGKNSEGIAVTVREVGEWIRQVKRKPVFVLSSCSGSSLRTAIETMRAGAQAVIGFRWDVQDRACVEYFRRFYIEYLRNRKTLPEAYCEACRRISLSQRGIPIWASAVAVMRD